MAVVGQDGRPVALADARALPAWRSVDGLIEFPYVKFRSRKAEDPRSVRAVERTRISPTAVLR
jgi:hypothetical protein